MNLRPGMTQAEGKEMGGQHPCRPPDKNNNPHQSKACLKLNSKLEKSMAATTSR